MKVIHKHAATEVRQSRVVVDDKIFREARRGAVGGERGATTDSE